jgi:TolA-binding protein
MKEGLNRNDIDSYMRSSDSHLKQRVEEKVLEDAFERDALDGFQEVGETTSSLKNLDKKFAPKTYTTWIIVSSISISIAFIVIAILFQEKEEHSLTSVNQAQVIRLDRTEVITPTHIDTLKELPVHKQIEAKQLIKDFNIQKEQPKNEAPQTIVSLDPKPITLENDEKPDESILEQKQIIGKEIYLHELKLLDYRAYRSKPKIKTEQLILSGIPADLESGSTSKESEWQTIEVPYIEYLERTMELFSRGSYKKALNRFEVILTTYPDDVNALFYAGLCYYNLKNASEAATEFGKCLSADYSNFNEEAEWYYALSLASSGELEQSKYILKRIASSNGYYAAQAAKKLNSL